MSELNISSEFKFWTFVCLSSFVDLADEKSKSQEVIREIPTKETVCQNDSGCLSISKQRNQFSNLALVTTIGCKRPEVWSLSSVRLSVCLPGSVCGHGQAAHATLLRGPSRLKLQLFTLELELVGLIYESGVGQTQIKKGQTETRRGRIGLDHLSPRLPAGLPAGFQFCGVSAPPPPHNYALRLAPL